MNKMNTLTKVVGAMSLGALVGLVGCSKKDEAGDDNAGDAATTEDGGATTGEATTGEGGDTNSCGGEGSCGGEMGGKGK